MWGAIAGMGVGSVMGFMGAQSANAAAVAAYNLAAEQTAVKRQWIKDRMNLQHRQSGIARIFETLAVEKKRIEAAGRNRAGAAARGVAFSGGAKHKDDIINAVDAAHAHKGVGMRTNKRDIDINAQAWSDEFAAVSALRQFASQTNSSMKDPLMTGMTTGLGMGGSVAAIGGAFSPPSGGGGVTNNYGVNFT